MKQCLPECNVRDITELLGMDGLIKESSQPDIKVPFLVAKDSLDMPIVGFNVIEEIITNSEGCVSTSSEESMVDVLASSMKGVERGKVEPLVQFIKTETTKELSTVKLRKQDTVIPQG
ncbi:hypothetical protein OS493_031554 [Desmophyllum pertusum]|uniref:Uncharacterized protein n=1 Tax=Desmophyllum pertusum TaxID=174260 RepID=A0A9W9YW28_9CNID|nr:hypothetical protein OS493_031554 [Desmophyllum pertusum]